MMQGKSMFDPLLMGGRNYELPTNTNDLEKMQQDLMSKQQNLQQLRQQITGEQMQQQTPQQPRSQTPVWDEINAIMEGLSDQEFNYIAGNEEFQTSQNEITNILQSEHLRLMRPLVEQSQAGKDALDRHLTLVKRLRKTATKAVEDELALFNEYRRNYSHISFEEFMKMKRNPNEN